MISMRVKCFPIFGQKLIRGFHRLVNGFKLTMTKLFQCVQKLIIHFFDIEQMKSAVIVDQCWVCFSLYKQEKLFLPLLNDIFSEKIPGLLFQKQETK